MNSIIKLAIIGFGNIAQNQIEAVNKMKDYFKLIAIADINKEKENNVSEDINFYTDYNTMLKKEDIDAVIISVPNNKHYEVCLDVLEQNISVILEKPATKTKNELDNLVNLYKKNKIKTFYLSLHTSHSKETNWFVDQYNNGYFNQYGKIIGFKCTFYDPYIKNDHLLKNAKSLGGSWQDSGINALSVVNKIVDSKLLVEEAYFTKLNKFNNFEIQGTAYFDFPLDNMLGKGIIDTNWTLNKNHKKTKIYFNSTKNKILIDHTNQSIELLKYNGKTETIVDLSNTGKRLINHYLGVLEDFYKHYKNDTDNLEFSKQVHELYFDVLNQAFKGVD